MSDRNNHLEQRAVRVQNFGIQNSGDFAAGGKAQTHFANIGVLLKQLGIAKAGQKPMRVGMIALIGSLHLDLANISRTAQRIQKSQPDFANGYRLPDNTSDSATLKHADAVLSRLEDKPADDAATKDAKSALRAQFIAYELPADFITHLRADRDAITNADKSNLTENLGGVENTALVESLLGQINFEIAELDTIMHNKYTGQPEKIAAWVSASHVQRAARHKQEPPPTPPAAK